MNKVILMGRLTREPEIRYAQNEHNTCVGRFSLAVDRKLKREGQPDADFFNCTAFGKLGEFTEKYLRKGAKVLVEGEIHNDTYTNKDNQKIYSVAVIVSSIEFCEKKESGHQNNTQSTPEPSPSGDGFMNIPDGIDEELPFA